MNRTRIEWCDYTINPVKGLCPMACDYCYAHRMYKRFKWNPHLRYDPSAWLGLGSLRKPSRIFVGSTMELFHKRMNPKWLNWIMEVPLEFPQHTFIFLSKQPQNLPSEFPQNSWVGVTATDTYMAVKGLQCLYKTEAKVKFISFEPLLEQTCITASSLSGIDWLIIGQQTPVSAKTQPKIEWIKETVEAADRARVRVFLKDNLRPILCSYSNGHEFIETHNLWAFKEFQLRQEMPGEKSNPMERVKP